MIRNNETEVGGTAEEVELGERERTTMPSSIKHTNYPSSLQCIIDIGLARLILSRSTGAVIDYEYWSVGGGVEGGDRASPVESNDLSIL